MSAESCLDLTCCGTAQWGRKGRVAQKAIVTGANSGIGRATSLALAEAGYDVGFTHHGDGAQRTQSEIEQRGRRAVSRPLDLEDPEAGPPAIEALAEELGGLDVLVNNAGITVLAPFLELELADWRRIHDVDLTGAFTCAQAAARRMVDSGTRGRIVNVTSVHESVPLLGASAYCAAKGGLGMLTRCMAVELAEHGIRVNAIAPGEIESGASDAGQDPHTFPRAGIPLGHPGHTSEIGKVIAFLVSPDASYVTGQTYVVDGGLLQMAAVANQLSWGADPPPLARRIAGRLRRMAR
jgi:NAD(P)-dependent dehydrogenase (short-subunit alcohol dehydrogenase family)